MLPDVTPDERRMSVAFTGYRPSKLPYLNDLNGPECRWLYGVLCREFEGLAKNGFKFFLTGGALGCDLLAAEAVLAVKKRLPRGRVAHELCLPCKNHSSKWKEQDLRRLEEIKKQSMVTYVSDEYFDGCMQKRNRYMVDTSSVLVAVYDGISGGTKNTVEYAKKNNRKLIVIRPREKVRMQFIETEEDIKQLLLTDDDPADF